MEINYSDENTVEFLDQAGMTYMLLLIHQLNESLKEHGVESSSVRQEVCSTFIFNFSYNHDAGWLIEETKKVFPKVCFLEREPAANGENLGKIKSVHIPTEASSWHEYAYGVVSQYFEAYGEALPDVKTGSYDIEN